MKVMDGEINEMLNGERNIYGEFVFTKINIKEREIVVPHQKKIGGAH